MLDEKGYRLNVGMIITNDVNEVLWARRACRNEIWQFPQGGINAYETVEEAMYRELNEEVGLLPEHVEVKAISRRWLHYDLPEKLRRSFRGRLCVGQKQKWFLLQLIGDEKNINFAQSDKPEFKDWCWVDYWYPEKHIVHFKQKVYKNALQEFEPVLFN